MQNRARLVLSGLVASLSVAGCALTTAPEEASAPASTCDVNPEAPVASGGLRPQGTSVQGKSLNRISLNRIALNRLAANGVSLNGVSLNGVSLNGVSLNGVSLNKIGLNGVALDGNNIKGIAGASNELVGEAADGRALRGEALVGAKVTGVLTDGSTIAIDVTSFERTDDPSIVHYALAYKGQNLCEAGTGMFVAGYWDETGKHHATDGGALTASYTCVDGVIGKCAAWGYAAWKVGSEMHATCTRMGTADYCGSGISYTKDGTAIDMFDARGIQSPANEPGFSFEAAWGPNGAVCVSRPRYDMVTAAGAQLKPECWSALPSCTSLVEGQAHGATIANGSRPQSRTICE